MNVHKWSFASLLFLYQLDRFLVFFLPQNDLKMYLRKDLSRRLLSADFKKQVDGIEMLHKVFLDITLLVPWISLDI